MIDLVQHHEILRFEDPHRIFDPERRTAALLDAKKAGKLRYIGFTGHKDPRIHLHMLEVAREHGFVFDTAQMPLNVMDAHYRSFEKLVVPELVQDGTGVLGMKSMANGRILQSNTVTPIECLHYALNLPTSVVITGIDRMEILDQAFKAIDTFRPLSEPQMRSILAKTREAARTRRVRAVQDHVDLRRHSAKPALAGRGTATLQVDHAGLVGQQGRKEIVIHNHLLLERD